MIGCLGPAGGVRFDNGKSRERTCVTTYWGGRPFEIVTDEDLRRRAGSQDNTFFFPPLMYTCRFMYRFFFVFVMTGGQHQKKKDLGPIKFWRPNGPIVSPHRQGQATF